jgi:hypothetical protein
MKTADMIKIETMKKDLDKMVIELSEIKKESKEKATVNAAVKNIWKAMDSLNEIN